MRSGNIFVHISLLTRYLDKKQWRMSRLKQLLFIELWLVYNKAISSYSFHTPKAGYDTRSIFKRSTVALNSKVLPSYTSCFTKAKKSFLFSYFPTLGGRTDGLMLFPRVLAWCEMQTALNRIWKQNYQYIASSRKVTC